ncbi:secretion system type I outer membrane efflux pump lipoprotein NodT [Komagataeibacter oboediens DSM 11826]|uniref:Secretion protein n=1 Tax=Komagataeibacter oboediens TaxID=65958 RepID=A0A318QWE3_9PROT|nr:efflux transporter outer membrane subunit [Komagataeibacter oboediens]PYD82354.1 secretion protein [Komagataeibacter oboediens]GBR33223.1 secretion system type I outer membrane efflux pump lipoprotein NodT [Komagataeibacter oboediens DSM 11826]
MNGAPRDLPCARLSRRMLSLAGCAAIAGTLAGCVDLAPKYHAQHYMLPDNWKGDGVMQFGTPQDAVARGDWWKVFHDSTLDELEERASHLNPNLQADAEAFTQARDIAAEAQSNLYPQITGGAGASQNQGSSHRLWRGAGSQGPIYMSSEQYSAAARWEPDFWSAIRNRRRVQQRLAQAAAADFAVARLSIQSELANDYMQLRGMDAQHAVYLDSIRYYETAVKITKMRQAGAIAAGIDVSRAQTQLSSTQASDTDLQARRAVMEHAIAILVNVTPTSFHIQPRAQITFPKVATPVGIPATLLERRPDIASAERHMAAANRAIGVSRAAFYPRVTFSATAGFMDNGFTLDKFANGMYNYAAQAVMPLFQGGLRRAEVQRNWSQYRQAEDQYRAIVLDAFKDVEDGLSLTHDLNIESVQQAEAVQASMRTQNMTMQLYTGGLTNYLDVVVAQVAALQARIAEVQVETRYMQAQVELIRSLGGGWTTAELPNNKQIKPFGPLQYTHMRMPRSFSGVNVDNGPDSLDLSGRSFHDGDLTAPSK